jgi:hypothetical protein
MIDKDSLPLDKPRRTPDHPTKSHVVKTRVDGKEKIIRFGEQGASTAGKPKEGESDAMKQKRASFKARHAKNIAKGKSSPAYWADKVKWKTGGAVGLEELDEKYEGIKKPDFSLLESFQDLIRTLQSKAADAGTQEFDPVRALGRSGAAGSLEDLYEAYADEPRPHAARVEAGGNANPDRSKTAKMVFDSFKAAGFSDAQAKALTAEINREGSFNPAYLYGSHTDAANKATNVGMLSWQGDRADRLMSFMADRGLIDPAGRIVPGQEALNAQAMYLRDEMENDPSYARTRETFLGNPNIDPDAAHDILGKNFIRWRIDDPKYRGSGFDRISEGYDILNMAQGFAEGGLAELTQKYAPGGVVEEDEEAYMARQLAQQMQGLYEEDLAGQGGVPRARVAPQRPGMLDLGVGIPERLALINQTFNPVEAIGGAMRAGRDLMDPDAGGYDRLAALGNMLSGVAGVAGPAAIAKRVGAPAATAVMESLLGASPTTQAAGDTMRAVGRDVLDRLNQPGPVPVMYSNPITRSPFDSARADQEAPLAPIPRITPKDILDARIIPTVADLTRTGGYYTGIDASKIDVPEPMMGGPGYPLLKSSQDAGLAWAVQGKHVGSKKAGSGADLIAVTAMNPTSHQSNISFINSLIKTTEAYARDQRLPRDVLQELDTRVRMSAAGGDPALSRLERFPGFESPNIQEFINNASFQERSRIADIIGSKGMQEQGLPNINRLLQETVDPRYAGANPRDTLLFIEPDFSAPPVDLLAEGLPVHPSYRYGIRGRVFGALDQNISTFEMFPDFWGEKNIRAFGPEFNKGGRRAFDLQLPIQEVTGKQVEDLERLLQTRSNQYPVESAMRLSPIDTRIITNSLLNKWKPTTKAVNAGGASPQAFVDAINNNKYKPALTNYTADDIKRGAKTGDLTVYQLGDDDVFFGVDAKPDYSWAGVEMMPDDKALVGVVSNAPGSKGTAAPSVMAKAIEDGVTVLDAFAVPSKRFPDGFLPQYYKKFGFEEVGRVPFDRDMYIADHGEQAFKDLLAAWKSDGWDESMGMPPVIVMRWSGSNADRTATAAGIRGAGAPSHRAAPEGIIPEAEGSVGRGGERLVSPEAPGVGRGASGGTGAGDGLRLAPGTGEPAKGLLGLTPQQLRNRGIPEADIQEIMKLRASSLDDLDQKYAEGGAVNSDDELQRAILLRDLDMMAQERSPNAVPAQDPSLMNVGGIGDRLALVNKYLNPVEAIGGAMRAGSRLTSADASGYDRLAALGDMLSGVAGVAGPAAVAKRVGTPAAAAVMEGLTGGAPAANAAPFGKDWSDVYHWSRSPDDFSEFDLNQSKSAMSQLGPHVGTPQAAEARYMGFAKPEGVPPALGFTLPMKADLSKPFLNPVTGKPWTEMDLEMFISAVSDANNMDRRLAAPFMRERLAKEGYTSIPYMNDVEDAGSVSHIMLADRPTGSDAVLRSRFAKFDPAMRASKNISAGAAVGAAGLGASQYDPDAIETRASKAGKNEFAAGGAVKYDPSAVNRIINQLREVNRG